MGHALSGNVSVGQPGFLTFVRRPSLLVAYGFHLHMRTPHASDFARICGATVRRPTESLRPRLTPAKNIETHPRHIGQIAWHDAQIHLAPSTLEPSMKTPFPFLFLLVASTLSQGITMAAPDEAGASSSRDLDRAQQEVAASYAKAHAEIKEYVLWTARTFRRSGLWLPEDALADLPNAEREKKIRHLASLFSEGEYGRHLCAGLAEASALKDPRLVPGLIKVAGFHQADRDYDCRAKWMAVAALARQEAPEAVPVLISLVDHGNQNTRNWARAALSRLTQQDFRQDKPSWAKWWRDHGHDPVPESFLKPYGAPPAKKP